MKINRIINDILVESSKLCSVGLLTVTAPSDTAAGVPFKRIFLEWQSQMR